MTYQKSFEKVNRDMRLVAPFVADAVAAAVADCKESGYQIAVFEGYRTPARQTMLHAQGRTQPGKIVTNARPWFSWHQYGLAVDIAYLINGQWSWDGDFDKPAVFFREHGFKWLAPFERVHFEMTGGLTIEEARRIATAEGVPGLWIAIAERLKR